MTVKTPINIGTVGLERNRWGSREPSFPVSAWLDRFAADGFDGVELWEFHYTRADAAEQARLVERAAPLAVYNTYAGFTDDDADARARAAEAVKAFDARALKYNLGHDAARLDEYRRNLLAWAEALPAPCRLLCECHGGTVVEKAGDAAAFFSGLDPARFGVIAHVKGDAGGLGQWLEVMGKRLQHLHVQMLGPETDPRNAANRAPYDACFAALKAHGFQGSLTIEFTRGIGGNEDIEKLYANCLVDLAYCRAAIVNAA